MQEIKFRAWDKKGVMMYNPPLVEVVGEYRVMGSDERNQVIMQYIGLKDKNGIEIYEGDIVRYGDNKEDIQIVEFDDDLDTDGLFGKATGWVINKDSEYGFEVIGNIYEDEHLAP